MELNIILDLVKAGFSKDEIIQLAQNPGTVPNPEPVQMAMDLQEPTAEPAPVPAQVVEPVTAPAPQPAPQPVYTPAPVPTSKPEEPSMADLMQSIAKLTSAVQANAISQSVIPSGLQNAPSAEDMLAEIIRPTFKERR